jgi:O-antigen ligase
MQPHKINNLFTAIFIFMGFLLPFDQPLINYGIAALVIIFILGLIFKTIQINFSNRFLVLPLAFLALHLMGLMYSSNLKQGWVEISAKSSFLIFPAILASSAVNPKLIRNFKISFVGGSLVICLINMVLAIQEYLKHGSVDSFFYVSFSKGMHVQYLTIYLNIAILFLIEYFFDHSSAIRFWHKVIMIVIILFFFFNITFLASRLATVVSYITIVFYTLIRIICIKNYKPYLFLILFIAGFVISFDLFTLKHINRFTQVENFLNENENYFDFTKTEYNSTTLRIPLWINAYQVMEHHPLWGVGTGDVKESLDSIYLKNKFLYAHKNHFNPHNQYLQTGVAFGIIGLTLFLFLLLVPLYYAIRNKHYLFICLIVIFMMNMLTESVLERQAGIILFALLYSVFGYELHVLPQHRNLDSKQIS